MLCLQVKDINRSEIIDIYEHKIQAFQVSLSLSLSLSLSGSIVTPVMYMFCFLDKRESSPGSARCQDVSPVPGRQADRPVPLAASPVRGRGGHPIHFLSHCSEKLMSYLGVRIDA